MSETIKQKIERARKAFDEISDYTQEQVDKLIYEAGKIIYKNAAKLAEMAVNETGLGDVNEKILKNEETGAAVSYTHLDVYKRQLYGYCLLK